MEKLITALQAREELGAEADTFLCAYMLLFLQALHLNCEKYDT
ncbi:hypothetical protein Aazo_4755 ['Nostoc azollae' 0708]|jgi:hypothetical protein|uniref:Uncharacterized protein n=1 Tax=Nostoc azollae (strain 0708) TaxID=551115 RepID=D7DXW3_NOSA0|nr:hypothetical protein Aazo_4755 ['Nostoc azollae' 0708]